MTQELYKKYRPRKLSQVIGQTAAVSLLEKMLTTSKLPHSVLLAGPSGCGKTTIARILSVRIQCAKVDFKEINCANTRGIETVRDIQSQACLSPMAGPTKVWVLDEFQKTTSDAQAALLKLMEDTPSHVYFFLATTDPNKILKTIRNRCTEVVLNKVGAKDLSQLLDMICDAEKVVLDKKVRDKIIEAADGSPRKALVILDQVLNLENGQQLDAIEKFNPEGQAIEIARGLLKGMAWSEMAAILKTVDDDPESLRRLVLGYATTVLLNGKNDRAYGMITNFSLDYFATGKAGLVADCYRFLVQK